MVQLCFATEIRELARPILGNRGGIPRTKGIADET